MTFTAQWGTTSDVSVPRDDPLRFDASLVNTGGGYDPGSGRFTAPRNGTYLLVAHVTPRGNDGGCDWACSICACGECDSLLSSSETEGASVS